MRRFNRLAVSAVCAMLLAATALRRNPSAARSRAPCRTRPAPWFRARKSPSPTSRPTSRLALQTNETGGYVAPNLPPGDYSVRVEKQGFRSALLTQLTLNAASSVRADITLEVGQAHTDGRGHGGCRPAADRQREIGHHHHAEARGRSADGRGRRDAQPLRSRDPHARNRRTSATTTSRWAAARPRRFGVNLDGVSRDHHARAVELLGGRRTRHRSTRSPNSRSKPTAIRPSTATPAAAR